jgi:hypothetical protein
MPLSDSARQRLSGVRSSHRVHEVSVGRRLPSASPFVRSTAVALMVSTVATLRPEHADRLELFVSEAIADTEARVRARDRRPDLRARQ